MRPLPCLRAGCSCAFINTPATPAPLKVPSTPAPITRTGAAFRVLREVVIFESLYKSNKWIWLFGIAFHGALVLVLFRHLRYFIQPVWLPVQLAQPFGIYAGFAMVAALLALWARRVSIARVRYISDAFDHLILLLLILIGGSGLAMKFLVRTDIVSLKGFFLGLMAFDITAAARRSDPAHASGSRCGADGGFSLLEDAACAGNFLQPVAQSSR